MKIDWAVSLENGYVPQNPISRRIPVRCGPGELQLDYRYDGLTVASGTQANLVGINNLYTSASPPCNSGSPWVAFGLQHRDAVPAAKSRRRWSLRPMEPKWRSWKARAGLPTSTFSCCRARFQRRRAGWNGVESADSTSCASPTTPGCMTSLTIETTATNSNSSPWVDYNADTAY